MQPAAKAPQNQQRYSDVKSVSSRIHPNFSMNYNKLKSPQPKLFLTLGDRQSQRSQTDLSASAVNLCFDRSMSQLNPNQSQTSFRKKKVPQPSLEDKLKAQDIVDKCHTIQI